MPEPVDSLGAGAKTGRQAPPARGLDRPALIDQVPRLLADFARVISTNGERPSLERIAEDHADEHAAERIDQGFLLSYVGARAGAPEVDHPPALAPGPPIPAHELRLFAALAQGATSAIVKHRLREQIAAEGARTAEFRERFIAIVSHDLRTPMNAIAMAATTMLKSPDLSQSLAKPAGRTLVNVDRMGRMVSDLLDFTRGRLGGGMPTRPRSVDLRAVVIPTVNE